MTRKGKEKIGESSTPKFVPMKPAFTSHDSKSGSESKMDKKKKDDDARLFNNFEIRASIASGVKGNGQLFRNQMHRDYNELLLSRGIMNNRSVDFAYLDSIGILVKQHFEKLGIYEFCLQSAHVYPELIACFYSNLSFLSLNWIQFTVADKKYDLNATTLAEIIGVKPTKFIPIEVSAEEAYKATSENLDFSI